MISATKNYAAEIRSCWRDGVQAIFETGKLLIAAKGALKHGDFEGMIGGQLPFGASTARRLMRVAADKRLSNRAHGHVLPPSWRTLYELSQLDDASFAGAIEAGLVTPDMERSAAAGLRKTQRRRERLAVIRETFAPSELQPRTEKECDDLVDFAGDRRWPVILADPPWRYEDPPMGRTDRSIENHYETMPLAEILAMPVGAVAAERAALFLWATAPNLPGAIAVIEAWGFKYRTQAIWDKGRIAMGAWLRNRHEVLLIATRGDFPAPAPEARLDSIQAELRGEHSVKPEWAYRYVEAASPDLPRLELFGRARRAGWTGWGKGMPPLALPAPSADTLAGAAA